jgi:Glu-tRNA(Gln) amidotransferase subunit E-like FAD-binding protein
VVTCVGALDARPPLRTSHRRRAPSLVRATLHRNGVRQLTRDPLVQVPLSRSSRIVAENGSVVWCARYPGLAGLFRKDRGPSKELGRALCDEVKARFACPGFLTTDELPRYGIGRAERGAILAAAGAGPTDCVIVYAYPRSLARSIDEYVHRRLVTMAEA